MLVHITKSDSWYSLGEIYDVEFKPLNGYYTLLRNRDHKIYVDHCHSIILVPEGTFEWAKTPEVDFALETCNLNVIIAYERLINPKNTIL